MAQDIARAVPKPGPEPAADIAPRAPRPVHGPRAGWVLSTVVATAAAWAVGWVAGVSWAWHEMMPRRWSRVHRRRVARRASNGSPPL